MGKKKTFTMNFRKGGVTVNKKKSVKADKPASSDDKDQNKTGDK